MGRWRLDAGIFKRIFLVCRNDAYSLFSGNWRALRPMYPDRMFLLVVMNAVSSHFGTIFHESKTSSINFRDFLFSISRPTGA